MTDDTAAINRALAAGGTIFFPAGTYLISAPLLPVSNSVLYGVGVASLIQSTRGDISQLEVNGRSKVVVRDLAIRALNVGAAGHVAGIKIEDSTDCVVERVDFGGMSYHGVYLRGACLRNTVRSNRFHDFQGTLQDASDVMIYAQPGKSAPAFNLVTANECHGGTANGVMIQDPYTLPPVLPQRNTVEANVVGRHTQYGVAVYLPNRAAEFTASVARTVLTVTAMSGGTLAVGQDVFTSEGRVVGRIASPGTGAGRAGTYNLTRSNTLGAQAMISAPQTNSYNKLASNRIEDIQGSYPTNRDSGAGIYVVGAGAGGTSVVTNTVRNCCVQTLTESLTPGAIGVNGIPAGCAPVVVEANVISEMSRFHGIVVAGGNAFLRNNSITHPATNASGVPVSLNAASTVAVMGNTITHRGTGASATVLQVYANGRNVSGVTISDNRMVGGGYAQIRVVGNGFFGVADLVIADNRLSGIGTGGNAAIYFENGVVTGGSVTGNIVESVAVPALKMVAASNVLYIGNVFNSTGTHSIVASGDCTNSYLDQSNSFNARMDDTTTAGSFHKVIRVAAVPSTGTWALPARAISPVGASGVASAWRLTAPGSPGIWVRERN